MATRWHLTFDCARPSLLAAFWALALGYVAPPPPDGFTTWEDWLRQQAATPDDWDDGAYLVDPDGVGPKLVAAGGAVVRQDDEDGHPDHIVMRDPEGNEFCVL